MGRLGIHLDVRMMLNQILHFQSALNMHSRIRSYAMAVFILAIVAAAPLSGQASPHAPPHRTTNVPGDSIDVTIALVGTLAHPADRAQIIRQHGRRSQGMILVTTKTGAIDLVSSIESFKNSRRLYGDDLGADLRRTVRHDPSPSRFNPMDIVQAQRSLTALRTAQPRNVPHVGLVPTLTVRVPAASPTQ
jgi:hypothetical protein